MLVSESQNVMDRLTHWHADSTRDARSMYAAAQVWFV